MMILKKIKVNQKLRLKLEKKWKLIKKKISDKFTFDRGDIYIMAELKN